jgi:hypothetical protein
VDEVNPSTKVGRFSKNWGRHCAALALMALSPLSGADDAPEYGVKAAFLLNFARFVEWPEAAFSGPNAPLEICIFGHDPFGRMLENVVRGEVVQDRSIVVRHVSGVPKPGTCQTFFVSSDARVTSIRSLLPRGVLLVSDDPRTLRDGAMIAFAVDSRRVRFDVNQKVAERAGLKISSKLLSIARTVTQ